MTIPTMLEWIENTRLSMAIREGGLPYPIIGAVHLLSIALFGGMLLMIDLRILGWAMPRWKVSDLWYQFRPWKRLGFVLVVLTGFLLTWSEPVRLYGSPAFWTKMVIFGLVGVHALVFRPGVYAHPEKLDSAISSKAKLAAALSLIIWTGLIVSGRFIAFDSSFEPKPFSPAALNIPNRSFPHPSDSKRSANTAALT